MEGQTKLLGNELMSSPIWDDSISIPSRWLFICLLLKTDDNGEIRVDEDFRVCSEISGLGIQSAQKALVELEKAKMITAYDDDTLVVHRIHTLRERQTRVQARAMERMRRSRSNRKANEEANKEANEFANSEQTPPTTPPILVQSSTSSTSTVLEDLGSPPVASCSEEVDSNEPPKTKRWADRPEDVDEGVWLEFVSLRRTKKATATDRVIKGLRKQAGLAGLTLQEAMETCIQHGWTAIKAEWLQGKVRNRKVYKGSMSEAGEIDF